jgi:hypothetical protein
VEGSLPSTKGAFRKALIGPVLKLILHLERNRCDLVN